MKFLKGLIKDTYYAETSEHKSMEKIKCPVCGKDIVVENVIDSNGTKTDTNKIDIYPVTITRYAFLEMIDSPFLNPEVKFGISTVIPTAYVFCSTSENLRKYTSKDIDKLISDAYAWADEKLTLDDTPELLKNITDQMMKLNKASPSGGTSETIVNDGNKKKE